MKEELILTLEDTRPDFVLAYAALARRVAAAHAFAVAQDFAECKDILADAMTVIKKVETTHWVIDGHPRQIDR